jgi:hypothetical protein
MRLGRTIWAVLLTLSLAMVPLAGAFALQNDEVAVSSEATASAHDCCPGESMPADHAMKDCLASPGCIAKCFNFYAMTFSGVVIPAPTGGTESDFASAPIHALTASPPFRPPRV